MASTEVAREHALGPQHLAGCLALSRAANWNQNEADWRLMLALGRGWGITLEAEDATGPAREEVLAASVAVIPYPAAAGSPTAAASSTTRAKSCAHRKRSGSG